MRDFRINIGGGKEGEGGPKFGLRSEELQGNRRIGDLVGGMQERASNKPSGALLTSMVTGVADYAMLSLLIGATAQGLRKGGWPHSEPLRRLPAWRAAGQEKKRPKVNSNLDLLI